MAVVRRSYPIIVNIGFHVNLELLNEALRKGSNFVMQAVQPSFYNRELANFFFQDGIIEELLYNVLKRYTNVNLVSSSELVPLISLVQRNEQEAKFYRLHRENYTLSQSRVETMIRGSINVYLTLLVELDLFRELPYKELLNNSAIKRMAESLPYFEMEREEDLSFDIPDFSSKISEVFSNNVSSINVRGVVAFMEDGKIPVCFLKRVAPGYECFLPYMEMYALLYPCFAVLEDSQEGIPFASLYSGDYSSRWRFYDKLLEKYPTEAGSELHEFFEAVFESPATYELGTIGQSGFVSKRGFSGLGIMPTLFGRKNDLLKQLETQSLATHFSLLPYSVSKGLLQVLERRGLIPFILSPDGVESEPSNDMPEAFENIFRSPWKKAFPVYFKDGNKVFLSIYGPFVDGLNSLDEVPEKCLQKKAGDVVLELFGLLRSFYFVDIGKDRTPFLNNYLYKFYESALKISEDDLARNLPVLVDGHRCTFDGLEDISTYAISEFETHMISGLFEFLVRNTAHVLDVKFLPEVSKELYDAVANKGVPFTEAVKMIEDKYYRREPDRKVRKQPEQSEESQSVISEGITL